MIKEIDDRLLRWAEWKQLGNTAGYPVKSILHPTWSPPSPGMLPTLRVGATSDAQQTHQALEKIQSVNLINAICARYLRRGTLEERAELAGCKPDTFAKRIDRAHREIARALEMPTGQAH